MTIVDDYLSLTIKYKKKYGDKTILLMQVGSFYEVYAVKKKDDTIYGSNILDFSLICDMYIAKKSLQKHNNNIVVMAGFGITQLDKYVKKLTEANYTIVVYDQDYQGKNSTRSLSEIISPGCHFNKNSSKLTNNIVCIWLHKVNIRNNSKDKIFMGISSIDNYTGKSSIIQFNNNYHHNSSTYDDVERQLSILSPSESIIIYNFDSNLINAVVEFIGITDIKLHLININDNNNELVNSCKNAEKQTYQVNIINKYFPNITDEIIFETFKSHEFALQSYVMLLNFVNQYNPCLVSKLSYPVFENYTDKLILANHSLKQLNIINDNRHNGKLSSISSLLNNCLTNMGKRTFFKSLNTPCTNVELLQESYDTTEYFINNDKWSYCRKNIEGIKDFDKFIRLLVLNRVSPKDLVSFYNDILKIKDIYKYLSNDKFILSKINKKFNKINSVCNIITSFIKYHLNLNKSLFIDNISNEKLNVLPPEDACFLNNNNLEEIDNLLNISKQSTIKLEHIKNILSNFIKNIENKKTTTSYVKIHETPKQDPVLTTTKRRIELLKSILQKQKKDYIIINIDDNITNDNNLKNNNSFKFYINDLYYGINGNNKKDYIINNTQISEISSNIKDSREKLIEKIKIYYFNFINELNKKQNDIYYISEFITWVDIIQNKSYIASKYSYCKPIIDLDSEKSYINFKEIRHPLIENLNTRELYVTNDLEIGNNINGLLLYGTNAVGKTSFIRSIGISIIMAQAGLFVPCSSFIYKPYNKIFTRIIGNDNLFKGLSTFAVEMSELRTILNYSDENSLVLGDELCSGTESNSAKSIFTAGIEWLYKKNCTFLFATHFHEINKYDEIINMGDKLSMMHMSVLYDKKNDTLVYDRKLKNGPGNNMYGLEVCKSLDLPDEFLSNAYNIRMKYDPINKDSLSEKGSHFNAKKLNGLCELCNNIRGTEVHHLKHQIYADDKNFIGSHHKNHKANLVNICYNCHKNIHKNNTQHKKVKTIDGKYLINKIN